MQERLALGDGGRYGRSFVRDVMTITNMRVVPGRGVVDSDFLLAFEAAVDALLVLWSEQDHVILFRFYVMPGERLFLGAVELMTGAA
jgi:hypothetical protein